MIKKLRLAAMLLALTASTIYAQEPVTASADTTAVDPNAVTAYSIRSGKLMVSSKANPKPTTLPNGAYTNESDVIIEIVNGRVARIQESTDRITEIASSRLNRQRLVMLTPSTNALMAVGEVILPSGTFKSADGRSSITIVYGRPTAFVLAGEP
jgi:hypothetical protein